MLYVNYTSIKKKEEWFSAGGNFASKGHLAMSEDIFDHHNLGAVEVATGTPK